MAATLDQTAQSGLPKGPPPAIKDPGLAGQDDGMDRLRIQLVRSRWAHQDMALLERDKQVETHCRMLMGDHWSVWSSVAGTFVNVAEAMGLPEALWRELPRVNKLADWFDLTVARLTENTPVLGAAPRDADRTSALLAQASDVLLPKLWDDLDMSRRVFEIVGWMAGAGWCFTKTYPDFSGLDLNADQASNGGRLVTRVLGPLDCRGEWGNTAWQEKRWHIHRAFLTPEQVTDTYGVEVKADTSITGTSATSFYRTRLERGPGHYGATDLNGFGWGTTTLGPPAELVTVDEMWERPSPQFPQGRLLIVTANTVLHDGPRPFPKLAEYNLTSPITYVEWMRVPGRPFGTSPIERGTPIQRQINSGVRQILLHRAKTTNPMLLINADTGLTEEDADGFGQPGSTRVVQFPTNTTQPPMMYVAPAALGKDAWETQEYLERQFEKIMDLEGAGGMPQTQNASGEQVKELRFNSDRPISVPVRHLALALEEIGCLWYCILPLLWPAEQVVAYTGEDEAARTLTLLPEFWDGKVKVQINAESMMPRSRQEREAQAFRDYGAGLFGAPGTPEANQRYYKAARYPDMDDTELPTGVDAVTMKRIIAEIAQGAPAQAVPMLEQWNYTVMKATLRESMAAPEFLEYPPPVQAELQMLWQRLNDAELVQAHVQMGRQMRAQAMAMQLQAPLAIAQAGIQGKAQQIAAPPEQDTPSARSSSGASDASGGGPNPS